jgi:hypothetical protein
MSSGFGLSLSGKGGLPPPHNNPKDLSTDRYQLGLLGDKKHTKKAVRFSPDVRLGNSTALRSHCACPRAQVVHVFPRIPPQLAQQSYCEAL